MGIRIRNLDSEAGEARPTVIPTAYQHNGNGNGNGNKDLEAMLHEQKHIATGLGATVEIRGAWVWATFPGKPSSESRQELKSNHWVWCKHHGKWAYRGKRSYSNKHMDWGYIITKYPEEDD